MTQLICRAATSVCRPTWLKQEPQCSVTKTCAVWLLSKPKTWSLCMSEGRMNMTTSSTPSEKCRVSLLTKSVLESFTLLLCFRDGRKPQWTRNTTWSSTRLRSSDQSFSTVNAWQACLKISITAARQSIQSVCLNLRKFASNYPITSLKTSPRVALMSSTPLSQIFRTPRLT